MAALDYCWTNVRQQQIPPLRCGMTTKAVQRQQQIPFGNDNKKSNSNNKNSNGNNKKSDGNSGLFDAAK
ncbi:hypothetical protein [Tunturiibacter lichenicola]|uniref:hypothetical protein n=1 Tax=Tunturiibacter lichenicola TaxID=2051959 RepID=UPI003D9B07FE